MAVRRGHLQIPALRLPGMARTKGDRELPQVSISYAFGPGGWLRSVGSSIGREVPDLEGCWEKGASRVTRATGPYGRRESAGIALRYGKDSQRSRWPRAAEPSGRFAGRFCETSRETAERSEVNA